jgi:hypothetical protein
MQHRSGRRHGNRGNSLRAASIEVFQRTDQFCSGTESTGIAALAVNRTDENTHDRRLDKPARIADGVKERESL